MELQVTDKTLRELKVARANVYRSINTLKGKDTSTSEEQLTSTSLLITHKIIDEKIEYQEYIMLLENTIDSMQEAIDMMYEPLDNKY